MYIHTLHVVHVVSSLLASSCWCSLSKAIPDVGLNTTYMYVQMVIVRIVLYHHEITLAALKLGSAKDADHARTAAEIATKLGAGTVTSAPSWAKTSRVQTLIYYPSVDSETLYGSNVTLLGTHEAQSNPQMRLSVPQKGSACNTKTPRIEKEALPSSYTMPATAPLSQDSRLTLFASLYGVYMILKQVTDSMARYVNKQQLHSWCHLNPGIDCEYYMDKASLA